MLYGLTIFDILITMRSNFANCPAGKKYLIKMIDNHVSKHSGLLDLSIKSLCEKTPGATAAH